MLLEELERQAAKMGQLLDRYDLTLTLMLIRKAATEQLEAHQRKNTELRYTFTNSSYLQN